MANRQCIGVSVVTPTAGGTSGVGGELGGKGGTGKGPAISVMRQIRVLTPKVQPKEEP
jgi:hypothetical protein